MSLDEGATSTLEGTGTLTVEGGQTTPVNDTRTVFTVVIGLVLIVLGIIIASTVLAIQDRPPLPEALVTVAGVGVGALASLLASTASRRT